MSETKTPVKIWNGTRCIDATKIEDTDTPDWLFLKCQFLKVDWPIACGFVGCTNAMEFLGEPVETLLFCELQGDPKILIQDNIARSDLELTYKIKRFPHGINNVQYLPPFGNWHRVVDSKGHPLYRPIDFAELFRETT